MALKGNKKQWYLRSRVALWKITFIFELVAGYLLSGREDPNSEGNSVQIALLILCSQPEDNFVIYSSAFRLYRPDCSFKGLFRKDLSLSLFVRKWASCMHVKAVRETWRGCCLLDASLRLSGFFPPFYAALLPLTLCSWIFDVALTFYTFKMSGKKLNTCLNGISHKWMNCSFIW